jgi:NAD(P)-dependent dehydrogenase (short-subunit alcohol dehydrogenase family)
MSVPFKLTKDGFETQMAVNYIGHFLLSHLLMPQLLTGSKESGRTSRIVNVASCAQFGGKIKYEDFNCTKTYHPGKAYCDSKLAQVMFTRHLHKMCIEKNWNVQPYSCHPGIVNTGIFENNNVGSVSWFRKIIMKVLSLSI